MSCLVNGLSLIRQQFERGQSLGFFAVLLLRFSVFILFISSSNHSSADYFPLNFPEPIASFFRDNRFSISLHIATAHVVMKASRVDTAAK